LLYEKFVSNIIPTKAEYEATKSHIRSSLEGLDEFFKSENLYLIGGSARAAIKTLKNVTDIDPTLPCRINVDYVNAFTSDLIDLKKDAKRVLMKEVPERAHTLMTGFAVFSVLAEKCGAAYLTVTDASVRDGYLKERLEKK